MATHCKGCGERLGFFARMFGDCYECYNKRRIAEEDAAQAAKSKRLEERKNKPLWRSIGQTDAEVPVDQKNSHKLEQRQESWVEVMLTLAWILCFCAAAVFAFLAVVAANNSYEQGPAIIFTAYAISLTVSGIIFAAIGKIISSLTEVNDNLRLLVGQNRNRVLPQQEGADTIHEQGV